MLGQGNYRMRLKHLIVSESKESIQKNKVISDRQMN